MDSFKIIVCCHKKTERIDDQCFPAILLGADYADKALKESFRNEFWDNMGDNIGQLHPYCAELTSIYWMWKNYDKLGNPDHIGLFHYRRFFNFKEELQELDLWKCAFFDFDYKTKQRFGWGEKSIQDFCKGYDLILPHSEKILDPHDWKTPATLETHYKHAHYPEDFDRAVELIKKKYPEYSEAVDRACNSEYGHFCNMFIMTREMFFDYAKWLFGIILPLTDLLPIADKKYEKNGQKRVLGFLGERLFNIWIDEKKHKQGVKIREVQRLTGYLSDEEKTHFSSTYGLSEYIRILNASKSTLVEEDINAIDVGNSIVHPCKLEQLPAVSILVPVYNVEPFLRECIESLIHQTLSNIEIIFVNNASTDGSLSILMEYYQKDPRIVVVEHKKNEGLPGSRNTALHYVRGKYFGYIDSDDICDLTMFEKLYKKAEELQADIVTCSVIGFIDTLENQYLHRPLEWFGNSDRILPLSQRPQQLMEPAAWCKLFKTSYIKGLDYFEFRPGTVSWEDVPAMTSAFIQTDRIATVQEALYFYRQRGSGNLSNGMTRRNVNDFITGVRDQQAILEKHNYQNEDVLSYIEEFKYLFAEWTLLKLVKRDIPYLFHHVGIIFKRKNRKYLDRVFVSYPQRHFMYCFLLMRSAFLYYFVRTLYRTGKKAKNLLRHLLDIKRDGCYRTFRIGTFHFKQLRKKYCDETIAWMNYNLQDTRATIERLNNQYTTLQNDYRSLEQANTAMHEANSTAMAINTELIEHNEQLENEKTKLQECNCTLKEQFVELNANISSLREVNAVLVKASAAFEDSHAAISRYNIALEKEKSAIQESYREQLAVNAEQHKQIDSLSTTVSTYQKEMGGFFRSVWTTGWIGIWKQYYYDNFAIIEGKKDRLKTSLDSQSIATIDRICYRNFELLPKQEESGLFLYDHSKIYTSEELKGAAQSVDEEFYHKMYVLPKNVYLETPVFTFHCGLKLLPKHITDQLCGKDFIDGGAYWGDSALIENEYYPNRIFAFEPQPENYTMLQRTIANNNLEKVVSTVKCGLGDCSETRKLYTNGMLSGSSLTNVVPVAGNIETVISDIDIQTIDDFVRIHKLNVGLIKLDIEGNESAAIRGAVETIKKFCPVLSIAIYHNPNDFFGIKPFIESLDLGYRFMVRKLVYHDLVTEVVLLGYVENKGDCII